MFIYYGIQKTINNKYIKDLPDTNCNKEGLASNLDIILTRWIEDRKITMTTSFFAITEALGLLPDHIHERDHKRIHESLLRIGWQIHSTSDTGEILYMKGV